jgi:hypothetical protein
LFLDKEKKYMNLRCLGTQVIAAPVLFMSVNVQVSTHVQTNSAARVAAEMTKGKLNPAESKAGDTVAVRLSDDLKSNGRVVLKKGVVITGVVRGVGRSEPKTHTRSMIEVNWIVPTTEGGAAQSISIALESVIQVNVAYYDEAEDSFSGNPGRAALSSEVATVPANPAMLSMPWVVAVDHQTSSAVESTLGSSSPGPLFQVGRGELVAAGGTRESLDLFSHLNNDTVITSPSKNFEISSGARMQLLVGVKK